MGALAGQVALVTGGGRGIGRHIALALAADGARVAVAARSINEIETVAEECRAHAAAAAIPLDVTSEESCLHAVSKCREEIGPPDILVNNAGVASSYKFLDLDLDTWEHTIRVDLTGAFLMTRAALPDMLESGRGSVIAVASIAAKIGAPYVAHYTAAKHGLLGLIRSLAVEYVRSGVTFNAVCPGYVDTEMTADAVERIMAKTGRNRDAALSPLLTPQGTLVHPETVAAVCVFLASPLGRSINGQAINIDGGQVQS